jgi:hypothetical protein
MIGLDPADYGTHSLRRTKATLIYRRTKNLRGFSCCSATPKSKALCDISGWKRMMLWRRQRKRKFNNIISLAIRNRTANLTYDGR